APHQNDNGIAKAGRSIPPLAMPFINSSIGTNRARVGAVARIASPGTGTAPRRLTGNQDLDLHLDGRFLPRAPGPALRFSALRRRPCAGGSARVVRRAPRRALG